MMLLSQAIIGISVGVHFKVSTVLETVNELLVVVATGLELMSIPPRPCPAEILTCVRLEFSILINKALFT